MGYKEVLINTNICVDAALFRKPYVSDTLKIIEISDSGAINGNIAAHSFDTIFYILRKMYSIQKRYALIDELRSVFKVAPISQKIIDEALKLKWPDFENAIHYRAAVAAGCAANVNRNPTDFKESELEILSPCHSLRKFLSLTIGIPTSPAK